MFATVMSLVLLMCILISCSYVLCVLMGLGYVYACENYVVLDQCDEPPSYTSLNLRRSCNVQGCVKIEHRNIWAIFSSSSPHAHVVSPLK